MLLQAILDCYFSNSAQFHFIEFMQLVHNKLVDFSGTSDPLIKVVKHLSNDHKIIFIDEFQIEDIADAMIIGTLIEALSNSGIRLLISSNSHPDNLYKDGLQRAKFLKTIDFINKNFSIHNLSGSEDYRLKKLLSSIALVRIKIVIKVSKVFYYKLLSNDITNQTEFFNKC